MDKQKQIEELAIRIVRIAGKGDVVDRAEALYDEDCRVIHKNAVVLTREEREEFNELYRSALQRAEKWEKLCGIKIKETRKETAEKFARGFINDILPKIMNGHNEKALQIAMTMTNYCKEITEGKEK